MAYSFSPEILVGNYIKSATNGRVISLRLKRILTLILIPLSIAATVYSAIMFYQGVTAIKKVEKLEKALRSERLNNSHYDWNYGKSQFVPNSPFYTLWEQELRNAKDRIDLAYYSPLPISFLLVVPWIILRLVFWIIDAKETEEGSMIKKHTA